MLIWCPSQKVAWGEWSAFPAQTPPPSSLSRVSSMQCPAVEGAVGRHRQELAPLHGDMVGVAQWHQVSLHRDTVLCLTAAVVVFLGVVIHTFVSWEQNACVSGPGTGEEEFMVQHLRALRTNSCYQLSEGTPEFCLLGSS